MMILPEKSLGSSSAMNGTVPVNGKWRLVARFELLHPGILVSERDPTCRIHGCVRIVTYYIQRNRPSLTQRALVSRRLCADRNGRV